MAKLQNEEKPLNENKKFKFKCETKQKQKKINEFILARRFARPNTGIYRLVHVTNLYIYTNRTKLLLLVEIIIEALTN